MDRIVIREVGPRDGLQNERELISSADKVSFIERLCQVGVDEIEATAFVKLPQFSDSKEVAREVIRLKEHYPSVRFSALVPNQHGYEQFREYAFDEVCFFVGASETFNQKNVRRSISDHINRFVPVLQKVQADDCRTLAYLSTVCGCPYEGKVPIDQVVAIAKQLKELGFERLSLGDTIGIGRPWQVVELIDAISTIFPLDCVAWHGHNTYGRALVNAYAAYEAGIRLFDSSLAGLGGCPYAPGAKGNLATEDLVDLFSCSQINTAKLDAAISWLSEQLPHRSLGGEVYHARHPKGEPNES